MNDEHRNVSFIVRAAPNVPPTLGAPISLLEITESMMLLTPRMERAEVTTATTLTATASPTILHDSSLSWPHYKYIVNRESACDNASYNGMNLPNIPILNRSHTLATVPQLSFSKQHYGISTTSTLNDDSDDHKQQDWCPQALPHSRPVPLFRRMRFHVAEAASAFAHDLCSCSARTGTFARPRDLVRDVAAGLTSPEMQPPVRCGCKTCAPSAARHTE